MSFSSSKETNAGTSFSSKDKSEGRGNELNSSELMRDSRSYSSLEIKERGLLTIPPTFLLTL